jgi:hypothetical protein
MDMLPIVLSVANLVFFLILLYRQERFNYEIAAALEHHQTALRLMMRRQNYTSSHRE